MAYERIVRRGPEREDERAAMMAWVVALCNWGGKGQKPRFEDFMPAQARRKAKEQTPEEMVQMMHMMFGTSPEK